MCMYIQCMNHPLPSYKTSIEDFILAQSTCTIPHTVCQADNTYIHTNIQMQVIDARSCMH